MKPVILERRRRLFRAIRAETESAKRKEKAGSKKRKHGADRETVKEYQMKNHMTSVAVGACYCFPRLE